MARRTIEKKFMQPDTPFFSWEQRKSNINFMSVFTDETAREFIEQVRAFSKTEEGGQDINVWINSQGGYCTSLLAMIDTMSLVNNNFCTIGIGQCASCGAVLLASGTKGKRYITENARVLIHQASGGAIGTTSEIVASAQENERINDLLFNIIANNSNFTFEQLKEMTKGQDVILTPEQAVEYGIVDAVLTKEVIARLNGDNVDLLGEDDDELGSDPSNCQSKERKSSENFESTSLKLEIKEIQTDDNFYYITGIASTPDIDRVDDIVEPQALLNSINRIGKPAFIHQHNMKEMPLGVTEDVWQNGGNTFVKLKMPKDSHSDLIKARAEMGAYGGLSIGYIAREVSFDAEGIRIIKDLDWFEVSLVTVQANPNAKVLQVKSQNEQNSESYATIENIQNVRDVETYLIENGITKNNAVRLISIIKKLVKGEPSANESEGEPNEDDAKAIEALSNILSTLQKISK